MDNREPKYKQLKTTKELVKEKWEHDRAEAMKLAIGLNNTYNTLRSKISLISKTGEIPDESVLRGYRKKIQDLAGGLRKLLRYQVRAHFNQGNVNELNLKLRQILAGQVAGKDKPQKNRAAELDEAVRRINPATASLSDPALQDAVRMLRDIARERILGGSTAMVAARTKKLYEQRKLSECEMENMLKDRCVMPILSHIYDGFIARLENQNIYLDEDMKNYLESSVVGNKSRREYINLLLDRHPTPDFTRH